MRMNQRKGFAALPFAMALILIVIVLAFMNSFPFNGLEKTILVGFTMVMVMLMLYYAIR